MKELTNEEKAAHIQQRLNQYVVQSFHFDMDIAANEAIGNVQAVEYARAEKAKLALAYDAIEALAGTGPVQ